METTVTTRSPSRVVIAFDATKDLTESELRVTINTVRARSDILREGDTLVVFGILRKVIHPLGYKSVACPESFSSSIRAMKEEVSRKVDKYVDMLQQCAEDCEDDGVSIEVKITAGVPIGDVILQEAVSCNAVIIYRNVLIWNLKFYLELIPCKVALALDGFVEVLRGDTLNKPDKIVGQKQFYYCMARPVFPSNFQANENINQSGNSENNLMPSFALNSRQHNFQSISRLSAKPLRSYEDRQDYHLDLHLYEKELKKLENGPWGYMGWFKNLVALYRANSKARKMREEGLNGESLRRHQGRGWMKLR